MKILVMGATGYVASRAIPLLLDAGHTVIAAARTVPGLDRFWWRDRVDACELDVLDAESIRSALRSTRPDCVLYLVHGMAGADFEDSDRRAAENVRMACDDNEVRRIVYLSGIIPPVAPDRLSRHLRSRSEVEEILSDARATVVTLRAAMIIGAGSTSFELMRQLAERLPVTVVPDWMHSRVEPLAITDLCAAVSGAFTADLATRHFDIGGGHPLPYPDLIKRFLDIAGERRAQVTLPLLPETAVAKVAGWIADIPSPTVDALMESLQEDMVPADDDWLSMLVEPGFTPTGSADAIRRALAEPDPLLRPSRRDPLAALPGDPAWTGSSV